MPRKLLIALTFCTLLAVPACNRQRSQQPTTATQPGAKRYHLTGKIIAVDKNAGTADIDNQSIPDFMDEMVMPYTFRPPSQINDLAPGDSITADVVVPEPGKYWLENVKVIAHSTQPAKPSASIHIPQPGDEVPDFHFINQSGKNISLHQYRGQTLLVTLIYTRCPFPDFCPRVSHEFAEIDRQLQAAPAHYGKTHLLSISFDPTHDAPKVLRDYGFATAATKNPALFQHWEFAAIPPAELKDFADYFTLTYQDDAGQITHSLSTAIISPDGKIVKWYHDADWQAADLLQEIPSRS
jgi:protein SCO1/2